MWQILSGIPCICIPLQSLKLLFNYPIFQRDMSWCLKLLNSCWMGLRNKAIVHNLPQDANLLLNQQWVVHNVKHVKFSDRASVVDN